MSTTNQKKSPFTPQSLRNALIIFIMILGLFFILEILPLHLGSRQLPWPDLIPEIKSRLSRILLIAIAAALIVSVRGQGERKDEEKK